MAPKRGVPRLEAKTNPYIFAFGMIVAAISSIALMFAAILATTSMIWLDISEVQADSLHIRHSPGPDNALPIPCHSHNDYWRAEPFTSAIATGCIGIEVDVWKVQNELMVGHAKSELSTERTFTSMYIRPLVKLLQTRNQDRDPRLLPRGVYDLEPDQTVVLLVDLKSNPDKSWPLLLHKLEPLRRRGWLSHVSDGKFVSRPITVVGTGDTKFRMVNENNPSRDVFFDAPLKKLDKGPYNNTNSYYASTSFKKTIGKVRKKGLKAKQLEKIRSQISQAHRRGLKVRYWGIPALPLNVRKQLEKLLLDEGVDVLNADDLLGAKRTFAERGRLNE